jgi:hypothetical protein
MHNFKKSHLSEKSPKIKVVEELQTYNFHKERHMFYSTDLCEKRVELSEFLSPGLLCAGTSSQI